MIGGDAVGNRIFILVTEKGEVQSVSDGPEPSSKKIKVGQRVRSKSSGQGGIAKDFQPPRLVIGHPRTVMVQVLFDGSTKPKWEDFDNLA
ncbi:MAG TPA: hypothetical protein QGH03_01115 [Candidatus Paceibacterota bacterium]|nr:hypothetical protein [Parcubacteria group bacterium]MDP6119571.1 hypothetical protein [Candidatus Paceibacterota bacterium]HJN62816.1 hypothetical protein [Candidatus Paceibacterota bacterium]